MAGIIDGLKEAIATMLMLMLPMILGAAYDKYRSRKRRSKLRQIRRRHELARHEDRQQAKIAIKLWKAEDALANGKEL